ncbi:MAG TPA: hypothetical protein VFU81_08945 [Thermomicrobiales bacterium]|nr:hypothetical protein [Thermomicrobiales bacterium]
MAAIWGALGIGLVWGWLAAAILARTARPIKDGALLGAATAGGAALLLWQGGATPVVLAGGGAGAAALLQVAWRQALDRRAEALGGAGER